MGLLVIQTQSEKAVVVLDNIIKRCKASVSELHRERTTHYLNDPLGCLPIHTSTDEKLCFQDTRR